MRKSLAAVLFLFLPPSVLSATPTTTVLDVQNMTCSLCSVTIRKALEEVPGVIAAQVDYNHKTATVTFDADKANPLSFVKATTDAGFPSTVHTEARK